MFILLLKNPSVKLGIVPIYTFVLRFQNQLEKSRNNKGNSSPKVWQDWLNRFLTLVLAFLFTFNLFSAESQANWGAKNNSSPSFHTSALSHFGGNLHHPIAAKKIGLPIEIISELEEDVEVEGFDLYTPFTYLISFYNSSEEQKLSTPSSLFFEEQSSVPLFILYHSWKTFLH